MSLPSRMTALLQPTYGQPDVLHVAEVDVPAVPPDSVLVRVAAAGINKADWHLLTGTPYLLRAAFGFSAPKRPIVGMAVAGRVVAVGAGTTRFAVGDAVCAEVNRGAMAEYACVPEKELVKLPNGVSFDDAATLPVAATTALQGLRAGGLKAGQSVLINGAAGGVGTFAVQIAKELGAVVTGVCSTANVALVRSLGADHVLDYTSVDFTKGDARYDVIFDLVGNHPLSAYRGVLTPQGIVVGSAGGAENLWFGPMPQVLGGLMSNVYSAQKFVSLMALANAEDLATILGWMAAGRVRAVHDRRGTLAEAPELMRYLGTGRTRGKSVVTFPENVQ